MEEIVNIFDEFELNKNILIEQAEPIEIDGLPDN